MGIEAHLDSQAGLDGVTVYKGAGFGVESGAGAAFSKGNFWSYDADEHRFASSGYWAGQLGATFGIPIPKHSLQI